MVGGKVIGIIRKPPGTGDDNGPGVTKLHVRDTRSTDQCCVDCREERIGGGRVRITLGDSVWWQSGVVLWTPKRSPHAKCGEDFDIRLPKVGYTYAMSHALVGED